MRRAIVATLLLSALVLSLRSTSTAPPDRRQALSPAAAVAMTARSLLTVLTVAAEEGGADYRRTAFDHWVDADHDSCDTREEVLVAEAVGPVELAPGCRVRTGRWLSWYDNATWTDPTDLDVDHMVPLKEAWESGARLWSTADRRNYANDLAFAPALVAVTDNVNSSKGDQDPADWLPALQHCRYVQQWLAVKWRWQLSIDARERSALQAALTGRCGATPVTLPRQRAVHLRTP